MSARICQGASTVLTSPSPAFSAREIHSARPRLHNRLLLRAVGDWTSSRRCSFRMPERAMRRLLGLTLRLAENCSSRR
jgi:hypothetical protein